VAEARGDPGAAASLFERAAQLQRSDPAGALGQDTRVMLANTGICWRWLTDCEDSPWPPSMRFYRQGADNDCRPVFARIARDIAMIE